MAKRREIVATVADAKEPALPPPVKPKKTKKAAPKATATRTYAKRRAIDYAKTPFGVLIGTSPVIQAAFRTEAEALTHISSLEIEKCFKACLVVVKPVKVETKISL